MNIFSQIRAQYIRVMTKVWVRKVYLVVGSTILLGIFYRPFLKSIFFPGSSLPQEQKNYYDLDNIYVVKKRKEELAALQRTSGMTSSDPDQAQTKTQT